MRPVWVLLACLLLAVPAVAQDTDNALFVVVCPVDDDAYCHGPGIATEVDLVHPDGTVTTQETGSSGDTVFDGLPAGTYTLRTDPTGFGAAEITIQVDGRQHAELLVASQQVRFHGRLVDEAGAALAGASFVPSGPFHMEEKYLEVVTDQDGRWDVPVMSGMYWVRGPDVPSMEILVDGTEHRWRLMGLEGSIPVTGTVTDAETGAPIEGAWIDGWTDPDEAMWGFNDDRNVTYDEDGNRLLYPDPWGGIEATTDADGRFEIRVQEGYLELSAGSPAHYEEWLDRRVTGPEHFEFELRARPVPDARIQGTVRDADGPVSDFWLDIESLEAREWTCTRDIDEPVHYRNDCTVVKDGASFAGAIFSGYSIITVHADRCDVGCVQYAPFATTLDIAPGETVSLDVVLEQGPEPDAWIVGTVRDANGTVGHADVSARSDWAGYYGNGTDDQGRFRIPVVAGHYEVNVWSPSHYRWAGTAAVAAGETLELDIVLKVDPRDWEHECWECMEDFMIREAMPMPPRELRGEWDDMSDDRYDGADGWDDSDGGAGAGGTWRDVMAGSVDNRTVNATGNQTDDYVDIPALPIAMVLTVLAALAVARRR